MLIAKNGESVSALPLSLPNKLGPHDPNVNDDPIFINSMHGLLKRMQCSLEKCHRKQMDAYRKLTFFS
jgi:hypothetical protein